MNVSYFPLFYSIWGLFDMFYLLVILFLKITEDYIANYSQAHDQKLVSIYQRPIHKHGNLGKGIERRFKLDMDKQSATSSQISSNSSIGQ